MRRERVGVQREEAELENGSLGEMVVDGGQQRRDGLAVCSRRQPWRDPSGITERISRRTNRTQIRSGHTACRPAKMLDDVAACWGEGKIRDALAEMKRGKREHYVIKK